MSPAPPPAAARDDEAADPRLAPFDYELPDELVARHPAARRTDARLMVLDGDQRHHGTVAALGGWLRPGDVLVMNDTRVLPARVHAQRASGGRVELLFLGVEPGRDGTWAMARPARRLKPGESLRLTHRDGTVVPGVSVTLRHRGDDGAWALDCLPDRATVLAAAGEVPLPPYLGRPPVPADTERYQTVFAGPAGAVAAPTAGLHLTHELLAALEAQGVATARVTLHVGAGTFRNLRPEDLDRGRLHAEQWTVSAEAAARINAAKAAGGRVVAVGTTSTRTLESAADPEGRVRAGTGSTELFIRPGYRFAVVDALLTNFHLPRSSLLMLVGALAGVARVQAAYAEAVARRYRFFSYGDAMLVLPPR